MRLPRRPTIGSIRDLMWLIRQAASKRQALAGIRGQQLPMCWRDYEKRRGQLPEMFAQTFKKFETVPNLKRHPHNHKHDGAVTWPCKIKMPPLIPVPGSLLPMRRSSEPSRWLAQEYFSRQSIY